MCCILTQHRPTLNASISCSDPKNFTISGAYIDPPIKADGLGSDIFACGKFPFLIGCFGIN